MPTEDRVLREQLLEFLRGGSAHADVGTALDDFPAELQGVKPAGAPYTAWQLLEHVRFTLRDLLEFCTDSNYTAPKWPDAYWPGSEAPPDEATWQQSARALRQDLGAFEHLVESPASNLYARIPWGQGQTLLREVLLAGDHTSYHLGQIVMLRKQLGAWQG